MTVVDTTAVADRVAAVRARIAAAGRAPDEITVVAVTKGFGADAVVAAAAAGIVDVGENYAQELVEKAEAVRARWHFLGHVQRNKVKTIAPVVHLWQGVDRVAAGEEIARRAPGARVLVQVRLEGGTRNGCEANAVPALVEQLDALGLDVRGLMAVGPVAVGPTDPAAPVRPAFAELRRLVDAHGLDICSMGMTDDLEVAVEEGSTMVRVGRGLFGARPVARPARR